MLHFVHLLSFSWATQKGEKQLAVSESTTHSVKTELLFERLHRGISFTRSKVRTIFHVVKVKRLRDKKRLRCLVRGYGNGVEAGGKRKAVKEVAGCDFFSTTVK